jgi:hypothetical protein
VVFVDAATLLAQRAIHDAPYFVGDSTTCVAGRRIPLPAWCFIDLSIVERLSAGVDVAADNVAQRLVSQSTPLQRRTR